MTVIKADDVTAAPVQAAIRDLHDHALATGRLSEPSRVEISPDKTVAVVALAAKDGGVEALRSEVVPATVGKVGRGRRDRHDRGDEGLQRPR